LTAGVFPRVREKGLLPILLRLQMRSDAPPLIDQVRLAMFAELRAQKIDGPETRRDESLWGIRYATLMRPGPSFVSQTGPS
jgi:hypothetical protein